MQCHQLEVSELVSNPIQSGGRRGVKRRNKRVRGLLIKPGRLIDRYRGRDTSRVVKYRVRDTSHVMQYRVKDTSRVVKYRPSKSSLG